MKRFVTLLLSAILCISAFSLFGCTRKKKDDEPGENVPGVTVNNNEVYYGNSKEGKQQIKVSFVEKGYGRKWLVEIAKQFVYDNRDYYIYVDGDPGLTESIATKLQANRNLSDVYCPVGSMWEPYVYQGYIEPITDVYNSKPDGEDGKTVLEKMTGSWKEYGYIKTQQLDDYYVLPWNEIISGIVYNAKMFRQYGWEVPTTTEELLALCEQILADTGGKIKPFVYGGSIGGYFDYLGGTWWMQQVGSKGMAEFYAFDNVEVFNPSKTLSKARQTSLEEFTKFFAGDARKYSIGDSMGKNHITSQTDFLRGNAAMIPNASWMEREMIDVLPADFEMRMMSVPFCSAARKDDDGNYIRCNYATAPDYMFVPKGAPNKEGAKKFLSYMNSDRMLKLYTKYTSSPRPLEYEVDSSQMSSFAQSVIELWSTSEKYFIYSKNPMYTKSLVRPNGVTYIDPYSSIVFNNVSGRRIVTDIYQYALEHWNDWVNDAG